MFLRILDCAIVHFRAMMLDGLPIGVKPPPKLAPRIRLDHKESCGAPFTPKLLETLGNSSITGKKATVIGILSTRLEAIPPIQQIRRLIPSRLSPATRASQNLDFAWCVLAISIGFVVARQGTTSGRSRTCGGPCGWQVYNRRLFIPSPHVRSKKIFYLTWRCINRCLKQKKSIGFSSFRHH
ncbi:MAG: hypothetical protein ACE5I5_12520 [Candidatus Heimdallarchaeota archaeon]